jgi:hypothetical protein
MTVFLVIKKQKNSKQILNLSNSLFKNIRITNTVLHTNIDLSNTFIENQFQFENTKLFGKIVIDGLNVNPQNARLEWSAIADRKITVFEQNQVLLQDFRDIHDETTAIPTLAYLNP